MKPDSPTEDSSSNFETGIETPQDKLDLQDSPRKLKIKRPKRNKSAFILFSIETRAKLREDENLNSNEMMIKLATLWKNLSKEERERYVQESKKDRIRYHQELEVYWKANPSAVIQNRTKKNHVKKPCSAYALFVKEIKSDIKKQYPDYKMADVLKVVSERWKRLTEKQRKHYQERAEKEKKLLKAKLEKNLASQENKLASEKKKKKSASKKRIKKKIEVKTPLTLSTSHSHHQHPSQNISENPYLPDLDPRETKHIIYDDPVSINKVIPQENIYSLVCSFEVPIVNKVVQEIQLGEEPQFVNQNSNIFSSEKPKKDLEFNLMIPPLDAETTAKSDLFDFLNFGTDSKRMDSLDFLNKTSLRLEFDRFGSNTDNMDKSQRNYEPRGSRSEILNKAILSALEFSQFSAQLEISHEQDNNPNGGCCDLGLFK